jgi:phage terminase large subunit-like protein
MKSLSQLEHWRSNPAHFIESVLHNPETGKPFVLLPAQKQFLEYAFRLRPDGRLLYPEQIYSCPKKSGKSAFAAIHMLTVLLLFGGAYGEGYCVANSLEQAESRVYQAALRIVEASPLLKREARIASGAITFPGFVITALGRSFAAAAGSNPTISVFDELWAFTSENSRRLFDEMCVSPARRISLRFTATYAGFSGESTLLEELHARGLAQSEVAPNLYAGDGLLMFWSHVPVAPWQDEAWLAEMRRSLRPNQYLRMIENKFAAAGEDSFIDMAKWDACVDPNAMPVFEDRQLTVDVGVDVGVRHDSTAITVVTPLPDGRIRLLAHRIFQPTPNKPLDFEDTVEAHLIYLCSRFRVRRILADPYQMQATAQRLQKRGLPIREFPQTAANLTAASQNLYERIQAGSLILYPDAAMRLAASRAVAIESPRGWRIAKGKNWHRIDVIVALAMACHATSTAYEPEAIHMPPIIAGGMHDTAIPGLPPPDATQAYYDWCGGGGYDPWKNRG